MGGRKDSTKRETMLNQACEILSRSGVVDTSLRSLAAQMDTSARMLIYYFGSKEKLILEVIDHEQQRAAPDPGVSSSVADLRTYILADWDSITRGEKHVSVRILEQVFGAACAQDSPYADYTAQTLNRLIGNFETRLVAVGIPGDIAATRAVVGLTALQGYLMRYFTAADPAAVDRDFFRFVDDVILAPF